MGGDLNFMVPVDSTPHQSRFADRCGEHLTGGRREMRRYFEGCEAYNAADHHDELFAGKYPEDPLIQLTSAQEE